MIFQLHVLTLCITNNAQNIAAIELWKPEAVLPADVRIEVEYGGITYAELLTNFIPRGMMCKKLFYYAQSIAQYNKSFERVYPDSRESMLPYFRAAFGDTLEKVQRSFVRGFEETDKDWLALMYGLRIENLKADLQAEQWHVSLLPNSDILLDIFLEKPLEIRTHEHARQSV